MRHAIAEGFAPRPGPKPHGLPYPPALAYADVSHPAAGLAAGLARAGLGRPVSRQSRQYRRAAKPSCGNPAFDSGTAGIHGQADGDRWRVRGYRRGHPRSGAGRFSYQFVRPRSACHAGPDRRAGRRRPGRCPDPSGRHSSGAGTRTGSRRRLAERATDWICWTRKVTASPPIDVAHRPRTICRFWPAQVPRTRCPRRWKCWRPQSR